MTAYLWGLTRYSFEFSFAPECINSHGNFHNFGGRKRLWHSQHSMGEQYQRRWSQYWTTEIYMNSGATSNGTWAHTLSWIKTFIADDVAGASTVCWFKLQEDTFNLWNHSQLLQFRIDAAQNQSESLQATHSPSLEETYTNATLGKPHSSESPTMKVLGVIWDPPEDCLHHCVAQWNCCEYRAHQRNVVSIISMTHWDFWSQR